jgi:hypothetical protein
VQTSNYLAKRRAARRTQPNHDIYMLRPLSVQKVIETGGGCRENSLKCRLNKCDGLDRSVGDPNIRATGPACLCAQVAGYEAVYSCSTALTKILAHASRIGRWASFDNHLRGTPSLSLFTGLSTISPRLYPTFQLASSSLTGYRKQLPDGYERPIRPIPSYAVPNLNTHP